MTAIAVTIVAVVGLVISARIMILRNGRAKTLAMLCVPPLATTAQAFGLKTYAQFAPVTPPLLEPLLHWPPWLMPLAGLGLSVLLVAGGMVMTSSREEIVALFRAESTDH